MAELGSAPSSLAKKEAAIRENDARRFDPNVQTPHKKTVPPMKPSKKGGL